MNRTEIEERPYRESNRTDRTAVHRVFGESFHLYLDPDQVWHFVSPDLFLKLFAKVISRQQFQAKSNFSSVYLTNLQGST